MEMGQQKTEKLDDISDTDKSEGNFIGADLNIFQAPSAHTARNKNKAITNRDCIDPELTQREFQMGFNIKSIYHNIG